METVRDRYRIGCAFPRPDGVVAPAVAADDLNTGVRFEPARKRASAAVGEEIHRMVPLQVNEDRAIPTPQAEGEIMFPNTRGVGDGGKR